MPAAKGASEGSFYQLTKGKRAGWWEGAVVIGWKPNGRPHRKTVTRKDEDEARKAYRALLNERDDGTLKTEAKHWTLAEWLPHWLNVIRKDDPNLAPSTRGHYESKIRIWIIPVVGKLTLAEAVAHPEKLEKVQAAMEKAGAGASNRKQVYVVLKAALDAAVPTLIKHNPMDGLDAPTVKRKQIDFLEQDDVQCIYQEILGDRMEARWMIALMLGLRQGEALGLEWKHINWRSRTVLIEQQLQRLRGKHGCGDPLVVRSEPVWTHGCGEKTTATAQAHWEHGCGEPMGRTGNNMRIFPCGHTRNAACPDRQKVAGETRAVYPCGFIHGKRCKSRINTAPPERSVYPCGFRWASKCPTGIPGRLAIVDVKSDRGHRTLPLTDDMIEILEDLRELQRRERLAEGDNWRGWRTTPGEENAERDIDLVFRRTHGKPLHSHDDWEAWKALLKRAGLAPKRLHDARHAAAVGLIDSGVQWDSLSRLMGHASSAFTSDIYGHLSRQAADSARAAMQSHHGRLRGRRPGTVTPLERKQS